MILANSVWSFFFKKNYYRQLNRSTLILIRLTTLSSAEILRSPNTETLKSHQKIVINSSSSGIFLVPTRERGYLIPDSRWRHTERSFGLRHAIRLLACRQKFSVYASPTSLGRGRSLFPTLEFNPAINYAPSLLPLPLAKYLEFNA